MVGITAMSSLRVMVKGKSRTWARLDRKGYGGACGRFGVDEEAVVHVRLGPEGFRQGYFYLYPGGGSAAGRGVAGRSGSAASAMPGGVCCTVSAVLVSTGAGPSACSDSGPARLRAWVM